MGIPARSGAPGCPTDARDDWGLARDIFCMQAAALATGNALSCAADPAELAIVLRARLPVTCRMRLALGALLSLSPDDAEELTAAVLHDLTAGEPEAPLFSYADEAQTWAYFASSRERRAYAAAIWRSLSDAEQGRFLHWIAGRAAA